GCIEFAMQARIELQAGEHPQIFSASLQRNQAGVGGRVHQSLPMSLMHSPRGRGAVSSGTSRIIRLLHSVNANCLEWKNARRGNCRNGLACSAGEWALAGAAECGERIITRLSPAVRRRPCREEGLCQVAA